MSQQTTNDTKKTFFFSVHRGSNEIVTIQDWWSIIFSQLCFHFLHSHFFCYLVHFKFSVKCYIAKHSFISSDLRHPRFKFQKRDFFYLNEFFFLEIFVLIKILIVMFRFEWVRIYLWWYSLLRSDRSAFSNNGLDWKLEFTHNCRESEAFFFRREGDCAERPFWRDVLRA